MPLFCPKLGNDFSLYSKEKGHTGICKHLYKLAHSFSNLISFYSPYSLHCSNHSGLLAVT